MLISPKFPKYSWGDATLHIYPTFPLPSPRHVPISMTGLWSRSGCAAGCPSAGQGREGWVCNTYGKLIGPMNKMAGTLIIPCDGYMSWHHMTSELHTAAFFYNLNFDRKHDQFHLWVESGILPFKHEKPHFNPRFRVEYVPIELGKGKCTIYL